MIIIRHQEKNAYCKRCGEVAEHFRIVSRTPNLYLRFRRTRMIVKIPITTLVFAVIGYLIWGFNGAVTAGITGAVLSTLVIIFRWNAAWDVVKYGTWRCAKCFPDSGPRKLALDQSESSER